MLYKNIQEQENEKRLLCEILGYMMTNEKAEKSATRLIEEFGCIKNILSAGIKDLQSSADMSENEAVSLSLFGKLMHYTEYETFGENPELSQPKVREKFVQVAINVMPYEDFYLFLLDQKYKLIKIVPVSRGSETDVGVNKRFILDETVKNGASGVIAVHTHPCANAEPSIDDIKATEDIASTLSSIDIKLVDHIIVGRDGICSLYERNIL